VRTERGVTRRGRFRHAAKRLPAVERRSAIVVAALEVFSSASYAGATTAELARAAGVSEPILYRHFSSKRELWFACLDAAWEEMRIVIADRLATLAAGVEGSEAELRSPWETVRLPNLWLQGLTEAGDDPAIRDRVRVHLGEVHRFVAALMRAQQADGRMPGDRDADAEAWIFLAGGLLRSVADRLGGVLSSNDLAAIGRERRRWLSGSG
jgi:AcrR family transcriptional regulator